MTEKIKIFIQDNIESQKVKSRLKRIVGEEITLDIKTSDLDLISSIPRNYDAYLIHFSNLNSWDEIVLLREEQPWSWIYLRTGGRIPGRIISGADSIYECFTSRVIEDIVDRTNYFRRFRDTK